MISVGIIGYGYWGPNLARNFSECSGSRLAAISELSETRREAATGRYPGITVTADYEQILNDESIDAVVIATPVASHHKLTMEALQAGKHVMVTKPMASSSAQAAEMIAAAKRYDRLLLVDHTFIYTGAVHSIYDMIANGGLGDVYYYDSVRVNLGLFQHDVDVVWDLAVHDLSIMDYVLPQKPVAVSATGVSHFGSDLENIAFLTVFFEGSLIAHIHVNWLAPVKVRRTLVGGSRKMIVYDELEPSEKLKVYDKGVEISDDPESVYKMMVGYRTGDMWAPKLDTTEALRAEVDHFVRCIEQGEKPITCGETGQNIVRMLEAATASMKQRGRPVELGENFA